MREMLHLRAVANLALPLFWSEPPLHRLAVAALCGAEVIGVWVDLEEAYQRIELTDPVL